MELCTVYRIKHLSDYLYSENNNGGQTSMVRNKYKDYNYESYLNLNPLSPLKSLK